MHLSRPARLGLVLLLVAGGCEPATPPDTATRTDSAGVMLVEYPALPPMEESRIRIAAEPELVLGAGGALSGPDHDFFQITGVSQLRDGTLVVANQGSSQLRFYGADGEFVRSVGREGDGPGEFQQLANSWVTAGDTLVVLDRVVRRLQYFSPEGAFVRTTSIITAPFKAFSLMPPHPQAVVADGRIVVFLASPWTPTAGLPERSPLLVALHRFDGGGWDSVRVVPGEERIIGVNSDGRTQGTSYQFSAYPVAAAAGATMVVADNAHLRVEVFDPDGHLTSVISASVPEVPVTADVIENLIGHMLDWVPAPDPDAYSAMIRRAFLASHAPFLPAIRAVFVDADERIWVERYDVPASGPSRWEVFERDGTWIGRVEMPEGLARGLSDGRTAPGFSIVSGRLAGVWTDPATGVETVRVYRVIETGS